MKRVVSAILVAGAMAGVANAAIVEDFPFLAGDKQPATTAAEPRTDGGPSASANTCHYTVMKGKVSKGCSKCPQKGDVYDSGIPCPPPCPRKIRGHIPCPDGGPGICKKFKAKNPRCSPSD